MMTKEQFEIMLPLACTWAEDQERIILREGIALSGSQLADANRIGVTQAGQVRLLETPNIPIPEHPMLRAAAEVTQLITSRTAGLTLRYGIYVRSDCWDDRQLLIHELVHTSQYERLGGFQQFLRKYLDECLAIGYPAAPMEQEAVTKAAKLCV